jgi:hypothetical protein
MSLYVLAFLFGAIAGRIVKRDDHLMDATRYLIVSGRLQMQLPPEPEPPPRFEHHYRGPDAWMQ